MPKVNIKGRHVPITKEEWRDRLDQTGNTGRGRFRLLTREMNNSRAYSKLTRGGMIFVNAMLDKLDYENRNAKDRKNVKRGVEMLKNDGKFTVTNNELHARGIASASTIAAARIEAWKLGFYDVIKSASLTNYGIYQYSERWKLYPYGEYLPVNQQRPGRCLYPNRPPKSKPTTKIAVKSHTEIAVKGSAGKPIDATEIAVKDKQRQLQESQLFNKLPVQAEPERSEARAAKRGDGEPSITDLPLFSSTGPQGGPPKHQGSKHPEAEGGIISPLDRTVLKKGIPAKISIFMVSLGHSCTLAQECPDNEVQLGFSNGVTVHVRPREYELVGHNGAYSKKFHDLGNLEKHLDELEKLLPLCTLGDVVQLPPLAIKVEAIMFTCGYGRSEQAKEEYGELHLRFHENVHAWIMPGSIKVERPGHRNLKVKDPEELERKLASKNGNLSRAIAQ
jgi:hypothetical protein